MASVESRLNKEYKPKQIRVSSKLFLRYATGRFRHSEKSYERETSRTKLSSASGTSLIQVRIPNLNSRKAAEGLIQGTLLIYSINYLKISKLLILNFDYL